MEKCKECGGSGIIEVDEKARECMCAFVRRMAAAMPVYVRKAEVRRDHIDQPLVKATRKHVMVNASWSDMKAIIKAVMLMNPAMFIKVTSDREIRDVYVGSKSRAARGPGGDDEGAIYNSLEDLMEAPHLVIIRLNELSYKNKAAPGALEEAVSYRTDRDKPTWLFSDLDKPFGVGSHAYSASVWDLVRSTFPVTRIPRILPRANVEAGFDDLTPLVVGDNRTEEPPTSAPNTAFPAAVPILYLEPADKPSETPTEALPKASAKPRAPKPPVDLPFDPDPSPAAPVARRPRPAKEADDTTIIERPRIRPSDDDDAGTPLSDLYGGGLGKKSYGKSQGFNKGQGSNKGRFNRGSD